MIKSFMGLENKSLRKSKIQNLLNSYSLNPSVIWKNIIWRFPKHKSNGKYVFIVGSPRSGTTLLQLMLAQHSKLFSYERESEAFSYRNIFDSNRVWFGFPTGLLTILQSNCSDIVDYFDRSIEMINKGENKNKRFIEKTPQHVLHLEFILKWFPKASVLHIVRDGRDCYCSSKINVHVPQNSSIKSFSKYWSKCVSQPIKLSSRKSIYTIKYEDLVKSPKSELIEIMRFLDLKFEDTQLDASSYADDPRADRIEFKRLAGEINSESTGRWKKELATAEIKVFNQIAGKQLRYYGYE